MVWNHVFVAEILETNNNNNDNNNNDTTTYPSTSYSDEPPPPPPKQDIEMNTITSTNDIQRLAHCVLKKKNYIQDCFVLFLQEQNISLR